MVSVVRRTRIVLLAGCFFSAVTVHSYFRERTEPPVREPASASAALVAPGRSNAAAVQSQGSQDMLLDSYTETILNNAESFAQAEPNGTVDLLNRSHVFMVYGSVNTGEIATAQDDLPDESGSDDGSVNGNTLAQLGGVTGDELQQNQKIDRADGLLKSLRPRARPEGLTRKVTSTQVPDRETQTTLGQASVLKRPLARPDVLRVRPQSVQQQAPLAEITLSQDAVTQAVVPGKQLKVAEPAPREIMPPRRSRDLSRMRLGKILGLFETSSKRWALVEDKAGRIYIMKPGDMIGEGTVLSISNGTMTVSDGAAFKEYYAGDHL